MNIRRSFDLTIVAIAIGCAVLAATTIYILSDAKPAKYNNPVEALSSSNCLHMAQMTNAQIIEETHLCESNGLNANAFKCGKDPSTIQIQCSPRIKSE